jgi:hypothetical protein
MGVGVTTVLYLEASSGTCASFQNKPAACPVGWTEIDAKPVVEGTGCQDRRTCLTTSTCGVLYLEAASGTCAGFQNKPSACPIGWTEIDTQPVVDGSGCQDRRTCIKC